MPQNYSGRVMLILIVLIGTLALIFSPVLEKLFHPSATITRWVNLKPGIDMVGGTSLVYEIKTPPGQPYNANLATKVAEALKRRVDPQGVKNLVWRPQGADRLEIQLPSSGTAGAGRAKSDELIAAEQQIEKTNVSLSDVTDAVEQKNGKTRADLTRLADGSQVRLDLFNQMSKTWDQIAELHKKPVVQQDPLEEAKLLQQYEDVKSKVLGTNLDVGRLKDALSDQTGRNAELAALNKQFADFPARTAAIAQYVSAYDAFEKVRGALDDTTDLKRMLRGSGVLEFHILVEADDVTAGSEVKTMLTRLGENGVGPQLQGGDRMRWFLVDKPDEFKRSHAIIGTWRNKTYVLSWITPDKSLDHREGVAHWALVGARPGQDANQQMVVDFTFDSQGGALFHTLTANNINKPLAIILDGKVISAPNINSAIGSSGVITGGGDGFSRTELDYLVNTLSAGSLPAQLEDEPISERHVEPELGRTNLLHGLIACGVGVIVVGVFLISYYYLAGVVAFGAVVMNLMIVLAVMAGLNATFTLPSIAGIVLSVGTAVDANVLIFERLREEQHRGLSLRMALRNAYDKAMSAIIDSNATTFITSVFLIWFGTEEVKGFGITLVIGIVASLFTALFVTRTVFGVLIDKFGVRQLNSLPLTFPKWDKLLKPNIDWMGFAWVFYTFSGVVVTIGIVMFVAKARQGQMMDIEFAGGTSVQFDLNQPMSKDELVHRLQSSKDDVIKDANPVALGTPTDGKYSSFDLLTPSTDAPRVRDALINTLQNTIKVEAPSRFLGFDQKFGQVLGTEVLPVTDDTKWPDDLAKPDTLREYKDGVAILLRDLNPPLKPADITDRINRQFLESSQSGQGVQRRSFVVVPLAAPNQPLPRPEQPVTTAVLLSKDANLPYSKDKSQWEDAFAAPLWNTVVQGVDRPAQLKEVRNFDAQIAGDAQTNALLALTFSIAVIMAYIWVRFGNLTYGTATVVALLHDTLFTIAALGFAHYLVNVPGLKTVLELEPFRINLTVVAGILTIMGYSMIDTIVVFDRIRENRGKYGHVSRQVINDAVNQTLSRTLLTAGTTTITVAIMYFMGGQGIHGFTFVLLIGILVGTYSSVAIAAPILLIGHKREQEAQSGARPARGQLQRAG